MSQEFYSSKIFTDGTEISLIVYQTKPKKSLILLLSMYPDLVILENKKKISTIIQIYY